MRPAPESRIAPADSARTPAFTVVPDSAAAHALLLDWLRSLPAELGRRGVVLVPAERVAHAIRRRVCVTEGHPEWLAGIRLIPAQALARDILTRAGTPALAGGNAIRRLRILDLFHRGTLALRYFRREQLRSGRGYGDAFARAIDDLETSGISATDLADVATELENTDTLAANRLGDVARVWRAAAAPASAHLTDAQVLQGATTSLTAVPELAASIGPIAALLLGAPSGSLLRFLASLPDALVLLLDALPLRTGTQRWRIAPPASAGTH